LTAKVVSFAVKETTEVCTAVLHTSTIDYGADRLLTLSALTYSHSVPLRTEYDGFQRQQCSWNCNVTRESLHKNSDRNRRLCSLYFTVHCTINKAIVDIKLRPRCAVQSCTRVGSTRGSGRVGSGQKIYKYEWVGSGPVRWM